ncbi:MAG: hypothetical protein GC137_02715 [Alphaproteobacteria bacterium]|nr:hypothetical protein [Alphaproteobacteria bacterium]
MALTKAFSALVSVSAAFKTKTSRRCALFLVDKLDGLQRDVNLVFPGKHETLGRNLYAGMSDMIARAQRHRFERALGDGDLYRRFALLQKKPYGGSYEVAAIMFNQIASEYQEDLDAAQDAAVSFLVDDELVEHIRAIPLNTDLM